MKRYQLYFILRIVIAFVLLFDLGACSNEKNNTEESKTANTNTAPVKLLVFDKLTGTWQSENGKNFERWSKKEDGTFQSAAFSIKGNDTSWNESAKIYPENNKWVFENTVRG